MRRLVWATAALSLLSCSEAPEIPAVDTVAFVDPMIGTGGLGFTVGSISPGPTVPFGLAKPSPDTSTNRGGAPGFNHCAGYYWYDDELRGFSQIHLSGTGVPDYGALVVMPMLGGAPETLSERIYRSSLDHAKEQAQLGRYSIELGSGIQVDIGATAHTSVYRFEYPEPQGSLAINLDHGLGGGRTLDGTIEVDAAANEVSGWLLHAGDLSGRFGGFNLFFVLRADRPFEDATVYRHGLPTTGTSTAGAESGAVISFAAETPVNIQIGLSFVDEAGARANLDAEWAGGNLEAVVVAAQDEWRRILEPVQVEGADQGDLVEFYTALYHAYQMPTLFTDVDSRYRGIDDQVRMSDGPYYSDFSLWDTYRTTHPLFTLLTPDVQVAMNRSLVAMQEAGGHLPRWPLAHGYTWTMVGNHGETMLADALVKGVSGIDEEALFTRLEVAARGSVDANGQNRAGRECITQYVELGYCPSDEVNGATSRTLENVVVDASLANLADALGKSEVATQFRERANAWRNVFNPETGFVQARRADGTFDAAFAEDLFADDLIEGNARQWTVYVPHHTSGLADAMGGTDQLIAWLESFFDSAAAAEKTPLPDLFYWHGNEPDIHAAYMFAELGRRDLTERWVDWIRDTRYAPAPDGLDGNDDGGTLSAWYVFSALGFYPLAGSDRYIVGAPAFDRAEVTLPSGSKIRIETKGRTPSARLSRVELDGEPLDGPYIDHQRLTAGALLEFFYE